MKVTEICEKYGIKEPSEIIGTYEEGKLSDIEGFDIEIPDDTTSSRSSSDEKSTSHKIIGELIITLQKINSEPERIEWLEEAKRHCDHVESFINPDPAKQNEIAKENGPFHPPYLRPDGFSETQEYILKELLFYKQRAYDRGKTKLQTQISSNADRLSIASDWMDPLMKKITSINKPANGDVLKAFEEVFPGFKKKFKYKELPNPFINDDGYLMKSSVGKAVKFIFEEKHNDIITADAIIRRYDKRDLPNW